MRKLKILIEKGITDIDMLKNAIENDEIKVTVIILKLE